MEKRRLMKRFVRIKINRLNREDAKVAMRTERTRQSEISHLQFEIMVVSGAPTPSAFIRQLPKAELHLHLEGAVEPATLLELRRLHGENATLPETEALYRYSDFQSFLMAFKEV